MPFIEMIVSCRWEQKKRFLVWQKEVYVSHQVNLSLMLHELSFGTNRIMIPILMMIMWICYANVCSRPISIRSGIASQQVIQFDFLKREESSFFCVNPETRDLKTWIFDWLNSCSETESHDVMFLGVEEDHHYFFLCIHIFFFNRMFRCR